MAEGAVMRRPPASRLAGSVVAGVAALLLAAAVGLAAVSTPLIAGGVVGMLLVGALASRAVAVPFGLVLLALTYTPEFLETVSFLSKPEPQKGLLLVGVFPLIVAYGVRPRFLLPLLAYLALGLMAIVNDDLHPTLSYAQMGSSLITLTVAWLVLAVGWEWPRDSSLLRVVAVLPFVSIAVGVGLQAIGVHEVWRAASGGDVLPRLQGAMIPPQLAMGGFLGAAVAYILHRELQWRWGIPLAVANAVVVVLTVSRGASIALLIAMAWPAVRYGLGSIVRHPRTGVLRFGLVAAGVAVVVAVAVPRLESRESQSSQYYPFQVTSQENDRSSGRQAAWREFYAIGKESPLFGHGLGSGPITKIKQEGFQAQHNEYLRMFVEGGYVGGGLVLMAIVVTIVGAIRGAPRRIRPDLAGIAVAFGVLAVTDNPLNSLAAAVPFCLLLGITSGTRRDEVMHL